MRNLSPELLAQLYAQDSSDPFLMLLTMTHPDWVSPFRLVNNSSDVISRTHTYIAYPFNITLPVDDGETLRQAEITIDAVSQDLVVELRKLSTPVAIKLEMVVASLPDIVQIEVPGLQLKMIQYNAHQITGKLLMDDFLATSLDVEKYTPTVFPGIF